MLFIPSLLLLSSLTSVVSQSTLYVYAYSWTPGFCNDQNYPGCTSPESYWPTNLTIHGMWPQYNTTGYPSSCSNEPFDTSVPELIGTSDMIQYWPNVKEEESSSSYDSFWEHEWSKHGTCTGLSQYDYFNNAIKLTFSIPTPDILYNSIGQNVSANDLRTSFGGSEYVALQCSNQHLTGVYTCWNQDHGIPTYQIKCPASVSNEDTCKVNNQIIIMDL